MKRYFLSLRGGEADAAIQSLPTGGEAGLPRCARNDGVLRLCQSCLIALLATGLVSGCGTKGRLKSPSQIQAADAKKARKAEKDKEAQSQDDGQDAPGEAAPATSVTAPATLNMPSAPSPNLSPPGGLGKESN